MAYVFKSFFRHKFIIVLLVVCIITTTALFSLFYKYEEQEVYTKFQAKVERYIAAINQEIHINVEILHSIKSLFYILPQVSRETFHDFVYPLLQEHPSIQALEWVPKVRHEKRDTYEKSARIDYPWFNITHLVDGKIRVLKQKKVYFPVYYLEPYRGNELALGYDLTSEKNRLKTLMHAAETNSEIATAKITLVQDKRKKAGFLIYSPLYTDPESSCVSGFVVGAFKIDNIVASALKRMNRKGSFFTIIDVKKNRELLYESIKYDYEVGSRFAKEFTVYGRKWKLIAHQYQYDFFEYHQRSFLILLFGFLGTVFLVYWLYSRTKVEHNLRSFNDKLKFEVHQALADLDSKDNVVLRQTRLVAMREMLNMIAHQWRQPLSNINVVISNLQLDIDLYEEKVSDKQSLFLTHAYESLDEIEKIISELSTTINNFQNFNRAKEDREKRTTTQMIEKSLAMVESELIKHDISIKKEYKASSDLIVCENEIIQVFLNLFSNSKEHFIEGNTVHREILIQTHEDNKHIYINFCDNGGGIPDDYIHKVFEPYFSTKMDKNGTGLGLYMSKIIIEEHHDGVISASNKDEGSCFLITLLK